MKIFFLIFGIFILVLVAWGGLTYWDQIRGLGPAVLPPTDDIGDIIEETPPELQNTTGFPLVLPEGFSISVFAKDLPGARVMAFDGSGNMWVSQTSEGKITLLEVQNGKVQNQRAVFQNLQRPHGLTFHPRQSSLLYFAEENGVSRVSVYSEAMPEKLFDLPRGGNHFTRTLMFAPASPSGGPDGRLLTSVGSTCNVCEESDWRRAAVLVSDEDGKGLKVFAKGLRNAVFMTTHFVTGDIWVTEMGRDFVGDDLPPDEINILKENGNYGWPICYGKNIHDTQHDPSTSLRAGQNTACDNFLPSHIDLPAHVAPLGLGFIPEEGRSDSDESSDSKRWPEAYWYNLLVAYHGSWNRAEPTGYKIVRLKLDAQGNPSQPVDGEGQVITEDFISGWLEGARALGRPVDILIQPGGVMYISDDKAGLIYKVTYMGR